MMIWRGVVAVLLILGVVAPVVAFGLAGWPGSAVSAREIAAPRPIVTEIVEDRDPKLRWIPGVVASKTQVSMAFQTLGRMIVRHVDIGDRVATGTLLAELATEDLAATTRAARAALDAAEVQLLTARTTLARQQALRDRNIASAAQLEEAQRMMVSAEAAADQARSELVQAEDSEGHARMVAPFGGVVSAVHVDSGAVVSAGEPILQLSADDGREAVIDLPEAALAGLGSQAVFSVWQGPAPQVEIAAVLDRIEPLADRATRTRRLYLTLPDDAPFRLGGLIRARFGTQGDPVLTLPTDAVFKTTEGSSVWRVIRNGTDAHVEAVPVQTAISYQGRIIISTGIRTGDEIVIRGVHSLQPDQPVGRRVAP